MQSREDSQPLVRCLDIPCPWSKEYRSCAFRLQQRGINGFPNALCTFYSTPGPHAPSRIAKVTGLSIEVVNKTLATVHVKMREVIARSEELHHDPTIRSFVDDHVEGIPA